jgi:hypothetical protein
MQGLKNKSCAVLFSLSFATSTFATGVPVLDGALLNNDITTWVQDTMTELSHHIENYEQYIRQYELMIQQYTYLQDQYKGIVDSFSNINDLKSLMNGYQRIVDTYNKTIATYNNYATSINHTMATLCDNLESKALNASACNDQMREYLKSMEATVEENRKQNDPTVEGSIANQIEVDSKAFNAFSTELKNRPAEIDNKPGQKLTDIRTISLLQYQLALKQREDNMKLLNAIQHQQIQTGTQKIEEDKRIIEARKRSDEISKMYIDSYRKSREETLKKLKVK